MVIRVLLFGLLISSMGPAARADSNETAKWGQVGGWEIGVDRTVGNGCFAAQLFGRGTIVRIGLDVSANRIYLVFGHPNWKSLERGKPYPVRVLFDGTKTYNGEMRGEPLGDAMFLIHRDVSTDFVKDFMQRNGIEVFYRGERIANLSLQNAYAAVAEVINCQREVGFAKRAFLQSIEEKMKQAERARQDAEAKRQAEAKAEAERQAADAQEAKRQAEAKAEAERKAADAQEAKRQAEAKAEAERQAADTQEAKRQADAKAEAAAELVPPSPSTPAPVIQQAIGPTAAEPEGAPGLLVRARSGETLQTLYLRVYRGLTPPPFASVAAINPERIRPGDILTFPTPANGWVGRDDADAVSNIR